MKKIIRTAGAPKPVGPYSQAVEAGGFIFCSGQIAIDPKSDQVMTGPVEQQTKQVIENIQAVLKEAGLSLQNVIKSTIFLTNMNDFQAVNQVYAQYFVEEPPARSTIAVSALPKGVNVEIEVIAQR